MRCAKMLTLRCSFAISPYLKECALSRPGIAASADLRVVGFPGELTGSGWASDKKSIPGPNDNMNDPIYIGLVLHLRISQQNAMHVLYVLSHEGSNHRQCRRL